MIREKKTTWPATPNKSNKQVTTTHIFGSREKTFLIESQLSQRLKVHSQIQSSSFTIWASMSRCWPIRNINPKFYLVPIFRWRVVHRNSPVDFCVENIIWSDNLSYYIGPKISLTKNYKQLSPCNSASGFQDQNIMCSWSSLSHFFLHFCRHSLQTLSDINNFHIKVLFPNFVWRVSRNFRFWLLLYWFGGKWLDW